MFSETHCTLECNHLLVIQCLSRTKLPFLSCDRQVSFSEKHLPSENGPNYLFTAQSVIRYKRWASTKEDNRANSGHQLVDSSDKSKPKLLILFKKKVMDRTTWGLTSMYQLVNRQQEQSGCKVTTESQNALADRTCNLEIRLSYKMTTKSVSQDYLSIYGLLCSLNCMSC